MTIINNILCKTADFVGRLAEFTGRVVGFIVEFTIIGAFILAVSTAALLLWMAVPYFACMTLCGDDVNSIWQLYALFGIFGAWMILSKIVYDRLGKRK